MGTRVGGRITARMVAAVAVIGMGLALVSTTVSAQEEVPEETITTEETTPTVEDGTDEEPEETTPTVDGEQPAEPEEPTPTVDPESRIRIVITPSGNEDPCVPSTLGLQRDVESTDEFFRLTVRVEKPLCEPIEAKAAVYQLPGGGEEWPQTLVEVEPFTIQEAGAYEVTFLKDEECVDLQFDVLTGETPETIAPLGQWHGPLLFPFDVATSEQWFGSADCPQPTVAPATTTPVAPAVAGTQQPASLALTGPTNQAALALGAALVMAGAAMLLVARRRTASA